MNISFTFNGLLRFFRALLAMAAVLAMASDVVRARADSVYRQNKDVVIDDSFGLGLTLDVFEPVGDRNQRAVVVVASGAWFSDRGKIRDLERAGLFDTLCGHGYVVFAVRPGSIVRFSANDMVHHVETGIRWVKANAATYDIDPEKLGLMGASAGGHLASLTALTTQPSDPGPDASVAAVGAFFPPTDFQEFGGRTLDPRQSGRFEGILRQLAFRGGTDGLSEDEIREQTASISPVRRVTRGAPPFLLIHGDADPAVPLEQSKRLADALNAVGVDARLIVKQGGGHPWPTIREEIEVMADWFDERLQAEKRTRADRSGTDQTDSHLPRQRNGQLERE